MSLTWLDRNEYPFASNWLDLEAGRLHYVDEGEGDPIVMIHGQPTWSFMYRKLVQDLCGDYRCIAPDLIGFGLYDKPSDWSYRVEAHGENLRQLIEQLGLKRITLVVHDWGGPIGTSYAVDHPDNIERIVFLNTWMWSFEGELGVRAFSAILGGALGRWLNRRHNLFARVLMKGAIADRAHWEQISRNYVEQFAGPEERVGCAAFPGQVYGAGPWLAEIWRKQPGLAKKPALFVWGMKDPAFREPILQRLLAAFPDHRLVRQQNIGHYVAEEMGHELSPLIRSFLNETAG